MFTYSHNQTHPHQYIYTNISTHIHIPTLTTSLTHTHTPPYPTQLFAGISGALLFACGIPGAALASMYTDRNGKFEYAAKLAFGLSAAILCAFVVVSYHIYQCMFVCCH